MVDIIIEKENIFDYWKKHRNYFICHCISADLVMDRGLLAEMNNTFEITKYIKEYNGNQNYLNVWDTKELLGDCIITGYESISNDIFNLVTKRKCSDKPTYNSLEEALFRMKSCGDWYDGGEHDIICPLIGLGCGQDNLVWSKVKHIMEDVFYEKDLRFHVCVEKKDKRLLKY